MASEPLLLRDAILAVLEQAHRPGTIRYADDEGFEHVRPVRWDADTATVENVPVNVTLRLTWHRDTEGVLCYKAELLPQGLGQCTASQFFWTDAQEI